MTRKKGDLLPFSCMIEYSDCYVFSQWKINVHFLENALIFSGRLHFSPSLQPFEDEDNKWAKVWHASLVIASIKTTVIRSFCVCFCCIMNNKLVQRFDPLSKRGDYKVAARPRPNGLFSINSKQKSAQVFKTVVICRS